MSLRQAGKRDPEVWFVTGFGSGFVPFAPGTWGSVVGVFAWWFLLADHPWLVQLGVIAVATLVFTLIVRRVCRRYEVHDAPEIVVDEIAGVWLALLAAPKTIWVAAGAFVLFRFFDILKPPPIGWLDRTMPGALGVMADDLLAGLASLTVLQVTNLVFIPHLVPSLN